MPPHHEPVTTTRPSMGVSAQMFLRAAGQVVRLLAGEPARRWRVRSAGSDAATAHHDLTLAHAALASNWREALAAAGHFAAVLRDVTVALANRVWAWLLATTARARRQAGPAAENAKRSIAAGLTDATRASRTGLSRVGSRVGAALLAAGSAAAARIDRMVERIRVERAADKRASRPGPGAGQSAETEVEGASASTTGIRGRSGRILSVLGGDHIDPAGNSDSTQQMPAAEPTWEEEDNFWWLPSRQAEQAEWHAEPQEVEHQRWDEPPSPSQPGEPRETSEARGATSTDDPPSATLG